jgi:thiosulfate/3-mercaptopyruvate sulfurtransferase
MSLSPLIQAADLAARLRSGATGPDAPVVVDCRFDLTRPAWGREQYRTGHLPGARYADLDTDLAGRVGPSTGRHPLPEPERFAAVLARWGVTPGRSVVAYDQGNAWVAGRLWWLLRASGHDAVQVLDGGLAAWVAAGLPLATSEPPPPAGTEPVVARPFRGVVDAAGAAAALAAGDVLVDARAADRFAGQNETIDPVAGHVPGATNHPFARNLGEDGRFLPPAELRARWEATLAGRAPARVVAMCGSGVTACHNLLALEIAGLPGGRLYAGSWSEWIRDPARPVATGA